MGSDWDTFGLPTEVWSKMAVACLMALWFKLILSLPWVHLCAVAHLFNMNLQENRPPSMTIAAITQTPRRSPCQSS